MVHYIILILLLILIFNYIISKSMFIYKNNITLSSNGKFKLLTYNIQRLPHLFRKSVNIKELMSHYDVICLQENFCSIFGTNRALSCYNCITHSCSFFKFIDSGLSIYSKYHIKFIDFVRFENLKSIDKFSDKGFLVAKIGDLILINLHLQAVYIKDDKYGIAKNQLFDIIKYCDKYTKVLICGDFNIDLQRLEIPGYNKIVTNIPTHWSKLDGVFTESSKIQSSKDFYPLYYDGGFYKNITVTNIKPVGVIDTDHLGVSFDVEF